MTHISVIRWLSCIAASVCLVPAMAQERIYRCGNEYTNDAELAKSRDCKPMDGGNFTVIQRTVPRTESKAGNTRPVSPPTAARSGGERIDAGEQRARDNDARTILESELRKAQERLSAAQAAYANGAPEKEGIEFRNHQRYLDRVAELKAGVSRAQSDVESIQRELGRLGSAQTGAASAAQ